MFSLLSHSRSQLIKVLVRKLSLPLTVAMVFAQGSFAVAQTSTLDNFDDLIDLLDAEVPDIIIGNEEPSSEEPEVIVEGESEGDTSEDVIIGNEDPRFTCDLNQGQYTVMYHPESKPGEMYPWAIPSNMGGGWDAQRRCEVISSRLENYRPDGLVELTTDKLNGYDILCVTTEQNPACRIVLTVPLNQDPITTRNQVFDNLITADSGQQTQGVYTFTERNNSVTEALGGVLNDVLGNSSPSRSSQFSGNGIYLKPFLDPQDGGTGSYLGSSSPEPSRGTLNPNIFR